MRVKVLQVVWHNKEPVFSVDFHPSGIFATGGADGEVKLWTASADGDSLGATFLSSVTGESYNTGYKAWNVVRFCPSGDSLAAAGDMGQICIFRPPQPGNSIPHTDAPWKVVRCSAYSGQDVVDMSWAADGSGFITASHDLTCMFWDAKLGKAKLRLEGHRLFVQGVAWDPLNQHIVSQGLDRACRVFSMRAAPPALAKKETAAGKLAINRLDGIHCAHIINKGPSTGVKGGEASVREKGGKRQAGEHLFLDESASTFFRRLCWSPDGSMLVVPAGVCKPEGAQQPLNVAYVFARGAWGSPALQLPATGKPVVAARFCPVLFELEAESGSQTSGRDQDATASPPVDLPYRMVFATATKDSVILYDTQSHRPLALLGRLHPETITDLAWSGDGRSLIASSYDGYCSIARFEAGELGRPVDHDRIPAHVRAVLWQTVSGPGAEAQSPTEVLVKQRIAPESEAGADAMEIVEPPIQSGSGPDGTERAKTDSAAAPPTDGVGGPRGLKRVRRLGPRKVLPEAVPESGAGCGTARDAEDTDVGTRLEGSREIAGTTEGQVLSVAEMAAAAGRNAASEAQAHAE